MTALALPILANLLLALGLALCVSLFLSLKQETGKKNKVVAEEQALLRAQICRLETELGELRQAYSSLETQLDELPRLSPPKATINTTRRSQVIRMHRRGERADQIAAVLGVPQGEVDLLLKLHDAVAAAS